MQELLEYLQSLQPGRVPNTTELEKHLAASWSEFDGSEAEGMAAYKLDDRIEDIEWDAPILSFIIVRHGATVLGSKERCFNGGCWTWIGKPLLAKRGATDKCRLGKPD